MKTVPSLTLQGLQNVTYLSKECNALWSTFADYIHASPMKLNLYCTLVFVKVIWLNKLNTWINDDRWPYITCEYITGCEYILCVLLLLIFTHLLSLAISLLISAPTQGFYELCCWIEYITIDQFLRFFVWFWIKYNAAVV